VLAAVVVVSVPVAVPLVLFALVLAVVLSVLALVLAVVLDGGFPDEMNTNVDSNNTTPIPPHTNICIYNATLYTLLVLVSLMVLVTVLVLPVD